MLGNVRCSTTDRQTQNWVFGCSYRQIEPYNSFSSAKVHDGHVLLRLIPWLGSGTIVMARWNDIKIPLQLSDKCSIGLGFGDFSAIVLAGSVPCNA